LLLEAAQQLFAECGGYATTTKQIGQQLNHPIVSVSAQSCSLATLYDLVHDNRTTSMRMVHMLIGGPACAARGKCPRQPVGGRTDRRTGL